MATRFYFRPDQSAPAGVAPARPAGLSSGPEARMPLSTDSGSVVSWDFVAISKKQIGRYEIIQGISEPLSAQTISGTVVGGCRGKYSGAATAGTVFFAGVIRVVSEDGTTVRGTLLNGATDNTALETTTRGRLYPETATALSSVDAQSGDRIVYDLCIEITATEPVFLNLYAQPKTDGGADITVDSTTGTGGNTYLEFSQDLAFRPPATPPTVTITSPSAASLTVPTGTQLQTEFQALDQFGADLTSNAQVTSSDTTDGSAGVLGTGSPLLIDTAGWADGNRTITVTSTDPSTGLSGTDSFTLTIGTASSTTSVLAAGGPLMLIAKDEATAGLRTVYLELLNADGTPYDTAVADSAQALLGTTAATNALSAVDATNGLYSLALTAAEVASEATFVVRVAGKRGSALVQIYQGAAVDSSGQVPATLPTAELDAIRTHLYDIDLSLDGSGNWSAKTKDGATTIASGTYTVQSDGVVSLNAA